MKEKEKNLAILNYLYKEIENRLHEWNVSEGIHDTVSIKNSFDTVCRFAVSDYEYEVKKLNKDLKYGQISRYMYDQYLNKANKDLQERIGSLNIGEDTIVIKIDSFECKFQSTSLIDMARKFEVLCNITAKKRKKFLK